MSKIRVLSDQVANQIAAGEVVERPASVAKELVENSIDAGARRIVVDVEAGGRRLLRVTDDGEGMTRDDALLAFERHATSKIHTAEDLTRIATLGFRGEALASIASVARVELVTQTETASEGTRVFIEGGRIRDVQPAAMPRGARVTVCDLFFNVPARRKFLRSEATESFHLMNLVTHYALAHPEIAFTLTNNGREVLRAAPAADLRERAYQIFGAQFIENLLEVSGGIEPTARVRGFISAPRERRTSRDAQYLFVNGRFVRDRLVSRALSEGYRSVLPHGVFPAALLFLNVPLEDVDVNVHPAKIEVRFRRAAAVADIVRDAVRAALARNGYAANAREDFKAATHENWNETQEREFVETPTHKLDESERAQKEFGEGGISRAASSFSDKTSLPPTQERIDFRADERDESSPFVENPSAFDPLSFDAARDFAQQALARDSHLDSTANQLPSREPTSEEKMSVAPNDVSNSPPAQNIENVSNEAPRNSNGESSNRAAFAPLNAAPPFDDARKLMREIAVEQLSPNIRPLGQLENSFIIATDSEGLLLIDQHVAHERILFDRYRRLEASRAVESQQLLVPETFDLTPAQTVTFDNVSNELERYGFQLMRLSGRTVAVKAAPADLPATEARSLLAEILDALSAERRGAARDSMSDRIAASLACRAAVKSNTPLTAEKMQWLIDRLLQTSSPTTCPHGRPVVLRIFTRDLLKGFQRT
jgi:DNA mismatch repair protein MutL